MSKSNDFAGAVTKQLVTLRDGNVFSVAKVIKEVGLIKTAAAKLDVRYHAAAVAALGCVMEHGQATPLADLLNALGKSARAKALADWAMKFSHVVVEKTKDKGFTAVLCAKEDRLSREELQDRLVKCEAEPFWTPEEKTAQDFNLGAALAMLLKKATSDKAKLVMTDDERLALVELQAIADKVKPVTPVAANDQQDALENAG